MHTDSSKSNSTQSLEDALGCEGTPSTNPKPIPCLPKDQSYATDWEEIMDTPFLPPFSSTREMVLFGFKNRTPRAGLLWSCEECCSCPPTPGLCPCLAPSSCPHQLCTSSQGLLAEMWDQADLCVWPWLKPSAMAPSHSPAVLPVHAAQSGTFCVF